MQRNINNGLGEKIAIIFYDKKYKKSFYTYNDLSELIDKFIAIIKTKIKDNKKKIVMIHGSASIETTIAILSCSKLGIHFSVIFEDLPKKAIELRIKILKPVLIITRFKKKKSLKIFNFKNIINFTDDENKSNFNEISIKGLKNLKSKNYNTLSLNQIKLYLLCLHRVQLIPKGMQHSNCGYLVYSKYTCLNQFGMRENSVVLAASDAGWINGHTYSIFGPLSIGSTSVL